MTGKELAEAVRKSWPMEDDTFMAGCIGHCGGGRYHIEFVRYRNSGGIVGRLSPREVAAVAPELVAALRADGAALRAFLTAEDGIRPAPRGVGSSKNGGREDRTRDGAGGCDCNGETRCDYARTGALRASSGVPGADVPGGGEGARNGLDGGLSRETRLTARNRKEGRS